MPEHEEARQRLKAWREEPGSVAVLTDRGIDVFSVPGGEPERSVPAGSLTSLAFSADGERFAAAGGDVVSVLDTKTGKLRHATAAAPEGLYFSGDEIEKVGVDEYVIKKGIFTSCEGAVPAWSFRVGHARIRLDEDEDAFQRHRLARARFADQPERLAGPQREADVLQGVGAAGVGEGDALEEDHAWSVIPRSARDDSCGGCTPAATAGASSPRRERPTRGSKSGRVRRG